METLLRDSRYALRMLARSPGFAVVVILTLALGVGVNTAFFSVANFIVLRPLPVRDPGQLVVLATVRRTPPKSATYPTRTFSTTVNNPTCSPTCWPTGSGLTDSLPIIGPTVLFRA